ncbi:hypothetical protein BDE02_18G122800 [Populus trichocarpa]|nr:hypothetical protein BDE02_18G122800 [Populus trichocarpa]
MGLFLQMLTVLVMTVSLQGWVPLGCLEEERIALLHLKDAFNYPNGTSLPSWRIAHAHCCDWELIGCNSITGRVTVLYLGGVRNEELGDWYLNASLFLPFQELNELYLWGNRIAGWVEKKGGFELQKLSNLESLYLQDNSFDNSILSFVEELPSLKSLHLAYNRLEGILDLKESLSTLEELGLGGNNINKLVALRGPSNLRTLYLENITTYGRSFQLLQSLGTFPNLTTLDLRYNDFRGRKLGDEFLNLSSLETLHLYDCSLDEHSLQSFGALPSLISLSLVALNSTVPSGAFLNLKNLEYLDLSDNTLDNNILQTIGLCDLNHLQMLVMSGSDLSGFLPPCLANLTSLQLLDLSSNHLKIPMSLSPLYNLSKLKSFDGWDNEIYAEEDDHSLSPKFQLESLYLSGRGQGAGAFPKFLYHQFNLQSLALINIQIKGEFPNWLIENNTYLLELFLRNCSLSGPFLLPKNSHNHFQGQIPSAIGAFFPGLVALNMSDNGFNGSIPSSLGNMSSLREIPEYLTTGCSFLQGQIFYENINLEFLRWLQLDSNQFDGIPDSLSNCSSLTMLDASNNHLSQMIPGWIGKMSSLEFLDLSWNNLSGPLPPSFNTSSTLQYVYLSRNKLQGPIARPFYTYSELLALDLSHNDLTGRVPEWIGRLSNLRFLLLSYNNLEGEIPIQLCRLDQLTLIDLSHNYLSGNILSCIISTAFFRSSAFPPSSNASAAKHLSLPYRGSILHYFTGIDFSCNNFTGKIPPEIGNLGKIKALNLSHNNLTGPIPPTFSRLKEIESLDLSYNKLEGEIPPQLTELYSLAVFSVAHNNLSGKTPARVAQFATFEESCYKDNHFLCGQPLSKVCDVAMSPSSSLTLMPNKDNSGFMDMEVFYITFGVAYIMVLLVIGAVLYINPYWRRAWFHLIEVSINNCYYFMVDNLPILSKFGFS